MSDIYQQINVNIQGVHQELKNFNQNIKNDLNIKYPPQDKNIPYSRVLSSISKEYNPKNKDIKYSRNNKPENIEIEMNPKISITLQEAKKQIDSLNELRKNNPDYNTDFLYALIYYHNIKDEYNNDIKDINVKNSMYKDLMNKYKL